MVNNTMNDEKTLIAPSILSADFARMGEEVRDITLSGADLIHVDVMDGMFVPNITFGPKMVKDIRPHTNLPLDVHLMIEQPWRYIEQFAKAGANYLTVHYKACGERLADTLEQIGNLGVKRGLAINPDVPFEIITDCIDQCDLLLIMSVFPGFGGQKFIDSVLDKIAVASRFIKEHDLKVQIEVDGGINAKNAAAVAAHGANILVAGSAVFGQSDYKKAIDELKV